MELTIGVVLLAMAIALIYLGLPDRQGNSPGFLRFSAASVLYPPLILVFIALGTAEIIFYLR